MSDDTTTHALDTGASTAQDGPRPAKPRREPLDAQRYRVIDQLGRGGMGDVALARDGVFGREVAVKRMLAADPAPPSIERFMREARIQGSLDHPAIPPVYELAIDDDGKPYFVMKRVAGTTLATILQRTAEGDAAIIAKFPRNKLLRAFADACLAVELAHTRGVIHRDLKPSNLMLGELGEVYVLDWGVAKVIDDTEPALADLASSENVTQEGAVVGTRAYMPPEQAEAAKDVDHRADVFALGRMLFEILTIKKAHQSSKRSAREAAPDRDVPPELDALCLAATEFDRGKRLATARQLGEGVQHYLDGDRDLEQRRLLAREHLERANAAEDPDLAMREAGRALALDPSLPGAAELVGRLMIEPPKTISPALAKSLADAQDETQSRHSRVGIRYSVLMYAPLLTGFLVMEVDLAFTLTALVLMASMVVIGVVSINRPRWTPLAYAAIGVNAVILGILSRVFTPFLIAPSLALLAVLVMVVGPVFQRRSVATVLVIAFSLGIIAPWIAELAGWVEPTTIISQGRMLLVSHDFSAGALQMETSLTIFGPLLITVATIWAVGYARNEDAARRQLHIQAWRLRQLVT